MLSGGKRSARGIPTGDMTAVVASKVADAREAGVDEEESSGVRVGRQAGGRRSGGREQHKRGKR